MVKTKDDLWADVIADKEIRILKKTKFCLNCGIKLDPKRPIYFNKCCCTKCALEFAKKEKEVNTND